MVPAIPFWGILTIFRCQCAGGFSFLSPALLPSSATVVLSDGCHISLALLLGLF